MNQSAYGNGSTYLTLTVTNYVDRYSKKTNETNHLSLFIPAIQSNLSISFQRQRKAMAQKLQNPRIVQISFHTLRHFKATMEYHKTRDILHVMQVLGHRSITNTLKYTQLISFKDDEFTAKVAHTEQELCQLLEAGYEFVRDYNQDKILKKRK
jgi:integrase